MKKQLYKKIVIKIGTSVLTSEGGVLNHAVIAHIVNQIVLLKKNRVIVMMVTSGAVGAGKTIIDASKITDKIIRRQILASVGQIPLMNIYAELFKPHACTCAQVLATKEDFRDRVHYLNMKNCFDALLHENIIPIINENDVISVDELMFSDNDELAGLVASMVNADALVIMTNVDGLMDGDPSHKHSRVISYVDFTTMDIEKFIMPTVSSSGRGGMRTKCSVAKKMSSLGITTHIINGAKENTLHNLFEGKKIGTMFLAQKTLSNVKRWIAQSEGHERGTIYINECASELLRSQKQAKSLLPVGITRIEGEFKRGDILKIKGPRDENIGWGMAEYSDKTAKNCIGKNRARPIIKYEYLYIQP
jgi:glutamate 5-kinase